MPPYVSRKRARSSSPAPSPPTKGSKAASKRAKPTLFETADAPTKKQKTVEENRKLLQELNDDDEDESLSEADSDEFEDVPAAKRRKVSSAPADEDEDVEEDEMDWEDAIHSSAQPKAGPSNVAPDHDIGDISFTIKEDGSYADQGITVPGLGKKGPSKREKQVRMLSHCVHVQSLMWHNTVRNSWLNDKDVQKTLVDGLTEGVKHEVRTWKEAMGTLSKEELESKKKQTAAKGKGKRGRKSKGDQGGRDWASDAKHLEQGVPNLSGGDPLLRLLKVLTAYWRKRFTVTAPALRKQGYMPVKRLRDEIKDWEKNKADPEEHGERVESVAQFGELAKKSEGSRDVGAQLFAALLRGLGLETRMVVNLQPVGFGFSKAEDADAKRAKKKDGKAEKVEADSDSDVVEVKTGSAKKQKQKTLAKKEKPKRKSTRGNKGQPINLDDSGSELSPPPSESEGSGDEEDDDDISVVDITPPTPKRKPNQKYDRDMAYPNYWVEVCSPVSHKYIPVDAIVLSTIASNDDLLQTFQPSGKKAEKAKQVMCYTIAFSSDGTAKDVTVRYLKKHQLPGKTKGVRFPAEKVPIYNRKGKVKRYEEYDWFRTVMSLYDRPEHKRTAADDLEDQTDLKPQKPEKVEKEVEKESLQWYKQSAEYVLEQHLRREEAIIPGAEPVKSFTAGKGDKTKEHPVFRRADVVSCKTVESWHKEGRALKKGQHPMKLVPMRAVTLIRKREMEDAVRETGEKLKQGLYSVDQTDWIIPPPIKDGVIPKNAYGNMDVYVPTMVPEGAVHLPLKGSAKLCRKLEIDYAEACTGFEFGKQRAVPVLTGVVVAEEHEILVRDAWRAEQAEVKRKEDTKRTGVALHWWRKMLLGLRVVERMRVDYADAGGNEEEINPFVKKAKQEGRALAPELTAASGAGDEMQGGGFFPPGHDEEEIPQQRRKAQSSKAEDEVGGGGFLADSEDEIMDGGDRGFLFEEQPEEDTQEQPSKNHAPITPVSLQSMHKTLDGANDDEDDYDVVEAAVEHDDTEMTGSASITRSNTGKSKRKPKRTVSSNEEDDQSSLSELEEASGDESDQSECEAEFDTVHNPPARKSRYSSPQVVITPGKPSPAGKRQTRNTRGAKKATPLKSQYFAGSDLDGSDGDPSTEEEVVRPRQTTARTRKARS